MRYALILLALLLAAPSAEAAAKRRSSGTSCWTETQLSSQRVRELQTMLMVGALQCRTKPELGILDNYNRFVNDFKDQIGRHNDVLKRKLGLSAYDRHTTRMAQRWSVVDNHTEFCQRVAPVAASAAILPQAELQSFSSQMVPELSVPLAKCGQKAQASAKAKPAAKKKRRPVRRK